MLRALRPALAVAVSLTASTAAQAQDVTYAPACAATGDQAHCVRVLACIGMEGLWFNGRAFGQGAGSVAGLLSDGAGCAGRWKSRNALGLGQAVVTCDNGLEVTVLYYIQDDYTGTVLGSGRTNRGELVRAWSGTKVLEYLRDPDHPEGENRVFLPCGSEPIPIG